ncbi:MAG: ACT domain-containing protein, partial [Coriobacteriales bacterium]|nr:ACT domain-containing protein [Coriobacteriales bacterium]
MLSLDHQLARVDGVYNAIFITGDSVGDCMFFGEGAGAGAAASAVMGDIIEVSRHIAYELPAVVGCTCTEKLEIASMDDLETSYYIRIGVIDEIGTLTKVASIFSDHEVSIQSILQNESNSTQFCNVVIITHKSKEENVMAALKDLEKSDSVKNIGTFIRIED